MIDRRCVMTWLVALWIGLMPSLGLAQNEDGVRHPLDALTLPEVLKVVEIMKAAGIGADATLYPMIALREPPKDEVLAWFPDTPFTRSPVRAPRSPGSRSPDCQATGSSSPAFRRRQGGRRRHGWPSWRRSAPR